MDIAERIKNLGEYFSEMQITTLREDKQQVIYVVVNFPRTWVVDEETAYENGVTISQGNNLGEYWFCAPIESGADVIFDVIDSNITKMKEAIERGKLLAAKTQELKSMFEDESIPIERLRGIVFTLGDEQPVEEIVITNKKKNKDKENE
jgi:hypothetical protein